MGPLRPLQFAQRAGGSSGFRSLTRPAATHGWRLLRAAARRAHLVGALAVPALAHAQGARVSGTVERAEAGRTVPVPGVWTVLHRMTRTAAGVADSVRTDRSGTYRFRVPADTNAQLVVAVQYAGVAYLSEPVVPRAGAVTLEPIRVHDTTSAGAPALAQRHVLIQPALEDGSRPVVELLILHQAGDRTLVGRDSLAPTWETRLIAGAMDVLVSEGDFGHQAVHVHGDSIELLAPFPPGVKELVLSYLLPASGTVEIPVQQSVGELAIMVADTEAVVAAGAVEPGGVTTFEGARYLRVNGNDLAAGTTVLLQLSGRPLRAGDFWWVIVVLAAAGMVAGFALWWRRGDPEGPAPELLAARIAALDRSPAAAGPDWPATRERLVATLAATLARKKGQP